MESNQTTTKVQGAAKSEPLESIVPFLHSLKESEQNILLDLYKRGARRDSINAVLGRFLDERVNSEDFINDVPAPAGSITFNLEVAINARYSRSPADIIYAALIEYRQSITSIMLGNLGRGDYQEAFNDRKDLDEINYTIDAFVEGLSGLANKNYWATQGETANGGPSVKIDLSDRFDYFMEELGLSKVSE